MESNHFHEHYHLSLYSKFIRDADYSATMFGLLISGGVYSGEGAPHGGGDGAYIVRLGL